MSKRDGMFAKAIQAGIGLQEREAQVSTLLGSAHKTELELGRILPRLNSSTRALSSKHLTSLVESISNLGLIEPIVIDVDHRLIAGLHRLAALRLLAEAPESRTGLWSSLWPESEAKLMPETLSQLPVREGTTPVHVLPINSSDAPELAFLIEVAENDKRRNYSHTEVQGFAQRLQEVGYRYSNGRPKEGEQALIPVLAATLGVSSRTVRRVLSPEKSVTRVLVSSIDENALVIKALRRWLANCTHPARSQAEELLRKLGTS